MALTDPELWSRLRRFLHGRPEAGGLVERVVSAQGVDKRRAQQLVHAYLRFIYLVAVSDEVLAPSKPVDEVWHLHLADGAGYRDAFCGGVVGRFINHREGRPQPAKDPAYKRTLLRYREEFGRMPDAKIWPVPAGSKAKPVAILISGLGCFGVSYVTALPIFAFLGLLFGAVGFVMLLENGTREKGKSDSGCGAVSSGGRSDDTCGSSDSGNGGGDGGCGGD